MQVAYVCNVESIEKAVIASEESNPTIYFSFLELKAADIKVKPKLKSYNLERSKMHRICWK